MSFKRFLNSHFVFGNKNHISFLQGSSFRFAVIRLFFQTAMLFLFFLRLGHIITSITGKPVKPYMGEEG